MRSPIILAAISVAAVASFTACGSDSATKTTTSITYVATLNAANERPNANSSTGTGTATYTLTGDTLRYWFPADGKGAIDNDLLVITKSSKSPVLAHLFLNHMLDYDVAIGNFGAIGYQPPQTKITPEKLVADGFVPQNLAPAVVLQSYFDSGQRSLELSPADDSAWSAVWQRFKAGG